MKKRILSVLLAVIMLVSAVPMVLPTFAATEAEFTEADYNALYVQDKLVFAADFFRTNAYWGGESYISTADNSTDSTDEDESTSAEETTIEEVTTEPATTEEETTTEEVTTEPATTEEETTTEAATTAAADGGCGSAIALSAISILTALGAAVVLKKKD